MSVHQIIVDLENEPGRKKKEEILLDGLTGPHAHDLFWVLTATYDPRNNYYIKSKSTSRLPNPPWLTDPSLFDSGRWLLHKLATRKITGNAAKKEVSELRHHLSASDDDLFCRILDRDLKCGINAKTLNRVKPGMIPIFPVMLAEPYSEKVKGRVKFPAGAQEKHDGMRGNVIYSAANGNIEFFTRNGEKLIIDDPQLFSEIRTLCESFKTILPFALLDGELVVSDDDGIICREKGNGYGIKAIRGTLSKKDAQKVCFIFWDLIDFGSVQNNQRDERPFNVRFNTLKSHFSQFSELKRIMLSEMVVVNSWDDVHNLYDYHIEQGHEGIILKNLDAAWVPKRTFDQIKFKEEKECDLMIVGYNPGTGKNKDLFGSIQCEDASGTLTVDATGIKDKERKDLMGREGEIVTIRYNGIISDSKNPGKWSLFLPRFVTLRPDKDEPDDMTGLIQEYEERKTKRAGNG